MTTTEIIKKAREALPYVCETDQPVYRVAIVNENSFDLTLSMLNTTTPNNIIKHHYVVEFRKQFIGGVVIGWEFVGIV